MRGWAPSFYCEAGRRGARPASRLAVLAQAGLTEYVPGSRLDAERGPQRGGLAEAAHWEWLLSDLERSRATYLV